MKKLLLTLGLFCFGLLTVLGQKLHTPAEIFKILEKSSLSYEMNELKKEILPLDRSNNLNNNNYYRKIDNGKILTYKYEIDGNTQKHINKAEKYFHTRKFSLAREMYLKAIKTNSNCYKLMTYIGQTYGIEKDFDKAIEWYKKTIDLNYIDYMAHWFLADAYKIKGELDKAVDEITIALVLNRNNPRIKNSFNEIYKRNKLKTKEWEFTPQMKIDSVGPKKVKIAFNADWLGYALVKAVWKYEPGYKKSMGVSDGTFSTLEEKECFVSLMTSFDKKKLKKHPEFKALDIALKKEMIDEFIFYEIILPKYPAVAYQLPKEFINRIKDYVLEVRGKLK